MSPDSSPVHSIERRGMSLPALGFGTFEISGETVRKMVGEALDIGYRHIDTAQAYRNEAEVGRGIADSGVPRRDIFLTTKVWVDNFEPAALGTSVRESLERLDSEYVDLLLLHWPKFDHGMGPTLEALVDVREEGFARNIGVSNFTAAQIDETARHIGVGQVATNQVEYHVFLGQKNLRRAMTYHQMALTAYMPLAKGKVINDPVLAEIGRQYDKTAAQVSLRWLIEQEGVAAIPATTKPEHARANFEIFDFELSDEDHERIAGLDKDVRVCKPESLSPEWDD